MLKTKTPAAITKHFAYVPETEEQILKKKKKQEELDKKKEEDKEKGIKEKTEAQIKKEVTEEKKKRKRRVVVTKDISEFTAAIMSEENQEQVKECMVEIKTFCDGGMPGLERLCRVIESIFKYYEITSSRQQERIIHRCGLKPYTNTQTQTIKFYIEEEDSMPRKFNKRW
jgi:NCAIR mutase (PurE)-related protein